MSTPNPSPPTSASSQRVSGFLFVLGAALLWSLAGIGIKLVPADGLVIAGLRSLFATPVFGLVLLWQARGLSASSVLRVALGSPAVWLAAVDYALTVVLFVLASKLTTAANAILLQYTAPIYVVLLSWPLLKEPVRKQDVLAVLCCLLGIAWFFADQLSTQGLRGNLLAMASGAGLGLLPLLLRRTERLLTHSRPPSPSHAALPGPAGFFDQLQTRAVLPTFALFLGNLLATLAGLPFAIKTPPTLMTAWLTLVVLGVLQIGAAYLLYAAAVRRLKAIECLMICTLEPILNPVWVALGTGELPSRAALIGGLMILCAVLAHGIYSELHKKRQDAPGQGVKARSADPPRP